MDSKTIVKTFIRQSDLTGFQNLLGLNKYKLKICNDFLELTCFFC